MTHTPIPDARLLALLCRYAAMLELREELAPLLRRTLHEDYGIAYDAIDRAVDRVRAAVRVVVREEAQ